MTEPAPTQQKIVDEYVRKIMDREPNMKQSEMRAMFACWAPSEIPEWFRFAMSTSRPMPQWEGTDGKRYANPSEAEKACGDDGYALVNHFEMERWDRQEKEARFFSWRWFFADQMLEWRNR